MASKFLEAGSDATFGLQFFAATSGLVSSSSAQSRTGPRSILCDTGGSGISAYATTPTGVCGDAGRVSFAVRLSDVTPNQEVELWSTKPNIDFTLQPSGKLRIRWTANNSADSSLTLSVNTWCRLCCCWKWVNDTTFEARIFVQAAGESSSTLWCTISNGTVGAQPGGDADVGYLTSSPKANVLCYVDDIYVDDSNTLTDIGDVHVTAKLPAAINTNSFDTGIGSGTNRWDRVAERALSETNGWRHNAATDVQENYGLQGASVGDVNLTGATLLARCAWLWGKRGDTDTRFVTSFKNSSKTPGTTLTITVSNPVVGHTYLIAFAMDSATGTVSATDNASTPNTYVVDQDTSGGGSGTTSRVCIIRGYVATATSLTTITITHPTVTARAAVVSEFIGILQTTPLDQKTGASGNGTSLSSGAVITTQNEEMLFGALGWEHIPGTWNAVGTGMTPQGTHIDTIGTSGGGAASNMQVEAHYAMQTATGSQTADGSIGSTSDWTACIATYKATGTLLGSPDLMNNGVETAIALAMTSALYQNVVDSASYPSNAAGIGMRSSAASPDTYLYECGTLIAYIPSAGLSGTVNQVTETDLAQAVTEAPKRRLVGQVSSSEVAQAIISRKAATAGQVISMELAQQVVRGQTIPIGQVTETALAQAVIWAPKARTVGQVAEADFVQAAFPRKTVPVGQITETSTAQAVTSGKRALLGQGLETDLPQGATARKTAGAALATETDAALGPNARKTRIPGQIAEADVAQMITPSGLKIIAVEQVLEADVAQAVIWAPKARTVVVFTITRRRVRRG